MDINELRGLLEPSAQDKQDALSMGLLGLGSGLLANSTGHYGQFAPAMGSGLQGGLQGYQTGMQSARENRMQDIGLRLKLAEMQKKQEQESRMNEAIGTLTPEQQRIYALGGGDVLAKTMLPEPEKLPWYVQKDVTGKLGINPVYAELEKTKAAYGRAPTQPMAPVAYVDGNGNTVWGTITDARGKPAANYNPTIQGQVAGAKKQAEANVELGTEATKSVRKSDQLLTAAREAENLLGKNITQSGIGAGIDIAGRAVGISPESSQNAAKLEALSGWMVANVPRMEGPQSNYDVENYKTMAGKIGDRTVPVAERKAALQTVVTLQEKYKHLNQSGQSVESTGNATVRKFNPATGRIE